MKIKTKGFLMLFFALVVQLALAQTQTITGTVVDDTGLPLPGASVIIKGTSTGTSTDFDGNFSINATIGDILIVSYMGFNDQEITVNQENKYAITLKSGESLDEVVVTALGIKREKKSLGFAQQSVKGENVVQAKDTDINSALAGKIAGVQLIGSPSSSFDNALIRLRGETGVLYVVDGVKIYSSSDINMEDVADISVLKGVAGTALYGTEARNGAVIITTKTAKNGEARITIDEALSMSSLYLLPEYQNQYGGGYDQNFLTYEGQLHPNFSADESWGPALDGTLVRHWDSFIPNSDTFGELRPWSANPDNIRDFYETATTNNLTFSLLKGGDDYSIKTTINNIKTSLIVPNTNREQTTISFKGSYNVSDKLKFNGNFNYQYRITDNFPGQGYGGLGSNFNQWWQRQLDVNRLKNYKQNGQIYSWNMKSASDPTPLYWNSPYFEVYENTNSQIKNAVYGSIGLEYEYNDHLSGLVDIRRTFNSFEYNSQTGWYGLAQPGYSEETITNEFNELYTQLNYDNKFGAFDVVANIGAQWNQRNYSYINAATTGGLQIPDYYSIRTSLGNINYSRDHVRLKNYSMFATASVGYDNFIYLDGSYRKEWSSTADLDNNSVDVYGLSASFIFSKFIENSDILSFGKIRAGIAQAPSFPGHYTLNNTYSIQNSYQDKLSVSTPNTLANLQLKGGIREEKELGTELKFLQNKIGLDFTYFHRTDSELPSSLTINGATGYTATTGNESINKTNGWELGITATPFSNDDFRWDVAFNIAKYRKKVIKINDLTDQTTLAGVWNASLRADEGDDWGNIYGTKWQRDDNGNILLDESGTPQYTNTIEKVANIQPDFTGGLNNMLTYKNFNLNFSMDFQKGGNFYSVTKMFNASSGNGAQTVGTNDLGNPIRDLVIDNAGNEVTSANVNNVQPSSGGIRVDGADMTTGQEVSYYVNPRTYFNNLYGVAEEWVYDASYIKLRQVSLGYTFPKPVMEKLPFDSMKLSVYANNLWLIYSKVNGIDPSEIEDYFSSGDARWVEAGQSPSQRTIGVDLKLSF
ncbi:SusC/RagA family TonB-linked outer membrane protein [Leeuwenhoekiella marinoflava]|nr:SusC/RagA family TonB-linked outer membrane protein [Leeuwenhoekiella marinoflava]